MTPQAHCSYHQALDALPFGKRLPGALYLIDPGNDARIPVLLRIAVDELRKRLDVGSEFNLLKFHTASPKISFLAYPEFEKPQRSRRDAKNTYCFKESPSASLCDLRAFAVKSSGWLERPAPFTEVSCQNSLVSILILDSLLFHRQQPIGSLRLPIQNSKFKISTPPTPH